MKFKSLFVAALAAVAVLAGCQPKEEPIEEAKLSVSPQTLSFEATAGEKSVQLTSTREWKAQIKYEGDAKDWLSVSPEGGSACPNGQNVTITAKANEGTDRKATVTFTIGLFKSSLEVSQVGTAGPVPVNDGSKEHPFTVPEAIQKCEETGETPTADYFYVKGFVTEITEITDATSFGNATFYIKDVKDSNDPRTGAFYCYRVKYFNGAKFPSTDALKVDDEVVVKAQLINFKGNTPETQNGEMYSINGNTGGDDPDPVEPITGENLLTNGSFETWTAAKPEAWDFTNGNATLTKVSGAYEGSNACEVGGDANSNKRLMSKEYNLKPGTYQIQVYVKGEGQYRLGYAKLTNHAVKDSQNDYIYLDGSPVPATADWTLHFVQFKIEAQTAVSIIVMNNKAGSGKSVIVDDVKLVTKDGGIAPDVPVTVVDATVAEILANPSSDVVYRLTGTVSSFNSEYCSFDLTDATGKIYVYSVDSATKAEYASKLKDGDTVTIEGTYSYYESKQQHEIINAKITDWKQGGQPGPGPEVIETTVAALLANPSKDVVYRLSGTVSGVDSKYCSFDLTDATGKIYVYSVDAATKAEYASKLKDGDTVTIEGKYDYYEQKQQHEITGAKITSWTKGEGGDEDYTKAEAKTVSEFLAAKDKATFYKLTGTVSNYGAANCRFDLTDATGTVYVYKVNNAADWSSQIHNGGTVTLAGKYDYYESGNQDEVVDAYILSYDASTEEEVEELAHSTVSAIKWTLVSNAYDATSSGQNKQTATVNGKNVDNLLKLSTSSKAGEATLTIPEGVSKIGFYACGWEATDLTVGSSTVSFKKNAGCTGNAPYTLDLSDDSDYYEVSVAPGTVTVKCSKRVLLIGINPVN